MAVAGIVPFALGAIAFWKRSALKQKVVAARHAKVSQATSKPGQSARQIKGAARVGAKRLKNDDCEEDDLGSVDVEMDTMPKHGGDAGASRPLALDDVAQPPALDDAEPRLAAKATAADEPDDAFDSRTLPARAPPMKPSVLHKGRAMDH